MRFTGHERLRILALVYRAANQTRDILSLGNDHNLSALELHFQPLQPASMEEQISI